MKICYMSKYANVLKYGTDTRHFSFSREFAKLGHDVTLIMSNSSHEYPDLPKFKDPYKVEYIDGVKVIIINLPKYSKATSVKRFWTWVLFELKIIRYSKYFFLEGLDAIIASSLSPLTTISGTHLKKKYKAKLIFEVRDIWPLSLMNLKKISKWNPIVIALRLIEKHGYKNAGAVVGTMPGIGKHIQATMKKPINCFCIPQAVDAEFYAQKQEHLPDDYLKNYLPNNKFIVMYAGSFSMSYTLDKILMAAAKIKSYNQSIHFVFVGEGIEKNNLLNIKEKYELDNVSIIPRVKKTQLLELLQKASVLIHSFKMEKVFEYGISPRKFIDYMYSARPIILMFSGMHSIINEANCGKIIPSEDVDELENTLIEFYNMSPSELDKMGQNGKEYLLKNLTFSILTKKYLDIINSL